MAVELYDEHEQSERVRKWLRENGFSIGMGIALALAGIFGWRQWQDYQSGQVVLANEYYTTIQRELDEGRSESAVEQFDAMRDAVGQHGYVALAGMLIAADHVAADQPEQAAATYQILLDAGKWNSLEPLIRVRMALVEAASGQSEQGLARLQGEPAVGYEALWHETRGDLLFELGRLSEAVEAYASAADQLRGEGSSFRTVEIKLDAVRSAIGQTEST
ncbi:MAG: tetratricopeptide repeat protein [Xanthomonadaceae bacterium]|nr:tetratricopeptide repeat protein [Xanthomonadaceae bacterium]